MSKDISVNIDSIVVGVPDVRPIYRWRLNEPLNDNIAHCSDPLYNGEWVGNREIIESHVDTRASRFDYKDTSSKVEIPYDYHWFETGNWTITCWAKIRQPVSFSTASPYKATYMSDDIINIPSPLPFVENNNQSDSNRLKIETFYQSGGASGIRDRLIIGKQDGVSSSYEQLYGSGSGYGYCQNGLYNDAWKFITIKSTKMGDNQSLIETFVDMSSHVSVNNNIIKPFDTDGVLSFYGYRGTSWQDIRVYSSSLTTKQLKNIYQKKQREFLDSQKYKSVFSLATCHESSGDKLYDVNTTLFLDGSYPANKKKMSLDIHGSPELSYNDTPAPNFPYDYGRKSIKLNSDNKDYLRSSDFVEEDNRNISRPYLGGEPDSNFTARNLGIWVKLDNMNTIQPIFSLFGGGQRRIELSFDDNGDLYIKVWRESGGVSEVRRVLKKDLPNSVTSGDWFFLHMASSYENQGLNYTMFNINVFIDNKKMFTANGTGGLFYVLGNATTETYIGKDQNNYLDGAITHIWCIKSRLSGLDKKPSKPTDNWQDGSYWSPRFDELWEWYENFR